jgi:hypothetical protein
MTFGQYTSYDNIKIIKEYDKQIARLDKEKYEPTL